VRDRFARRRERETGNIGEKVTEVVEFGSRRGGGRTIEKGRKRDGEIARG